MKLKENILELVKTLKEETELVVLSEEDIVPEIYFQGTAKQFIESGEYEKQKELYDSKTEMNYVIRVVANKVVGYLYIEEEIPMYVDEENIIEDNPYDFKTVINPEDNTTSITISASTEDIRDLFIDESGQEKFYYNTKDHLQQIGFFEEFDKVFKKSENKQYDKTEE